jgi:hypothetical protein
MSLFSLFWKINLPMPFSTTDLKKSSSHYIRPYTALFQYSSSLYNPKLLHVQDTREWHGLRQKSSVYYCRENPYYMKFRRKIENSSRKLKWKRKCWILP